LVASSATPFDTLKVPLFDPVDRDHFLSPANDTELLLYRMTFDTPVRLDCLGRALPGLAKSWVKDSTRRAWILTLKDEAQRYPDSPMSAHDIVAAWNERKAAGAARELQSAVAVDDRRIAVTLSRWQDSAPTVLADPAFSMAIGSAQRPPVKFETQTGLDPRDALDREADLVVTRDPALVDYVAERPEFATFPLPWSRTYVLAQTESGQGLLTAELNTAAVRSSLAKDAVRASARAAEPPYWWGGLEGCEASSTMRPGNTSTRVAYRKDDEVARGLAERIVALASPSAGLRIVGLDAASFAEAVRSGTDPAYVIGLPRQSLAPCRDRTMSPAGARLLPLIDTRAYAIVRRGAPPLTVEWDGTIRVIDP
jgi:hypothetical protein